MNEAKTSADCFDSARYPLNKTLVHEAFTGQLTAMSVQGVPR